MRAAKSKKKTPGKDLEKYASQHLYVTSNEMGAATIVLQRSRHKCLKFLQPLKERKRCHLPCLHPSLVSRIYQRAKKLSQGKVPKKKKDSMDEQLVDYPDTGRQKRREQLNRRKRRRERISKNGLHYHLQDPQSSLCQPWDLPK
ncbi:hypothetical protein CEXT_789121 [Caerostris extrusa]|uniref:Uncharacterized protein n=1 Tax=Caerostris extrusa TaxID=172846 RepID=A0AAV4TZD5_CAEEX|nr:hypothetical protein CEXT_789121 [Caerostris extrusa]